MERHVKCYRFTSSEDFSYLRQVANRYVFSNSGLDNIDKEDVESLEITASQNMLLLLDSQDTLELS